MRDRYGVVQEISDPVLNWSEGHQFSRGTNFQCFATTGDGSIVVDSKDEKVRLYGITSMRQAKITFLGLGFSITHVDVTYGKKWILATTDTYMILIGTLPKDKDGKTKIASDQNKDEDWTMIKSTTESYKLFLDFEQQSPQAHGNHAEGSRRS